MNIFVRSEGCEDPGKTGCGRAFIKVNQQGYSLHSRGVNVVIFSAEGTLIYDVVVVTVAHQKFKTSVLISFLCFLYDNPSLYSGKTEVFPIFRQQHFIEK